MAAAIPHSKTTQFKLKINIKNSRSSEFFDPSPSKADHLHEIIPHNGFSEEDRFSYESSIASKEFLEKYQIIELLGKGAQAEVLKVKELKSGEFFAAKFYFSNDPEIIEQIYLENQIISALSHPKIIKYQGFFENFETNCRILVTEFFDAIPFAEFLSNHHLPIEEIDSILLQIMDGLCYLHEKNISHQDFNVENVLINQETHNIKIIDFGISQKISKIDIMTTDRQGNFKFRAPKCWHSESQNCYFSDIWGFCLIVFSLFMKKALSSKKILKLNLMDVKKIEAIDLKDFIFEKTIKKPKIYEVLGIIPS